MNSICTFHFRRLQICAESTRYTGHRQDIKWRRGGPECDVLNRFRMSRETRSMGRNKGLTAGKKAPSHVDDHEMKSCRHSEAWRTTDTAKYQIIESEKVSALWGNGSTFILQVRDPGSTPGGASSLTLFAVDTLPTCLLLPLTATLANVIAGSATLSEGSFAKVVKLLR
ncbi:hypothetical protein J6590_016868 [Homalodisca vitripennis]|nr:hypothetical protein J6590_016868 [Homalodisca vitripennis]